LFAGNTDPYPFITAAYFVGTVGIFGITIWIYKQRSVLRRKLNGIAADRRA
jgi:hypothetical protein